MKRQKGFIFNSIYLIISRVSLAISGIVFWGIAARIYTIDEIGIGAVLISVTSLLVFVSSLGIFPTFIRFLPVNGEKRYIVSTLLSFSLVLVIIFCGLFLLGLDFFLPSLNFLKQPVYFFIFIMFIISMQVFSILDSVFIAFKTIHLVLLKNIIQNFSRIAVLFLLVPFGGWGIFSANCSASAVAIGISFFCFIRENPNFSFKFKLKLGILKKLLPFSLANFLNALSLNLPGMIFPIVILSLFSPREAGLFYIPWMIFMVYCGIIISFNSVFLMQSSYGEVDIGIFRKFIAWSFILGGLGFILFVFWGDKILLIFKKEFAVNSFGILRILFCSIFSFIINQIYITVLNVKKDIKGVGVISSIILLSIIVFSAIFLQKLGMEGMALAWLAANFMGNFYILIKEKRRQATFL